MSRQLLCLKCGGEPEGPLSGPLTAEAQRAQRGLHPRDVQQGWSQRRVYLSSANMPSWSERDVHCDLCNEVITGQIIVAVTTIPPDTEIGEWEPDYGRVMTPEEVNAYKTLSK